MRWAVLFLLLAGVLFGFSCGDPIVDSEDEISSMIEIPTFEPSPTDSATPIPVFPSKTIIPTPSIIPSAANPAPPTPDLLPPSPEPTDAVGNSLSLKSLLIYYGWPNIINGAQRMANPLEFAANTFGNYDYVVLGAGIELPEHRAHDFTEAMINVPATDDTIFFGYVDLGVSTCNFSLEEIMRRVDAWKDMGIDGIFLDDFGYDFLVSRDRQNQAVLYIHSTGLPVFANGWDPDDLFSSEPDSLYNPEGSATALGAQDFYLYESYQIAMGEFSDPQKWLKKIQKLDGYKAELGFTVLGVSTNTSTDTTSQKVSYAYFSALADGIAGLGWAMPHFSSDGIVIAPDFPSGDWGSSLVGLRKIRSSKVIRYTDTGRFVIDTYQHTGQFTAAD